MKRFLIVLTLIAFAVAAPVLACSHDCGGCDKSHAVKNAKDSGEKGFCLTKINKTVKNIDNGVEILFVTADAKAADYIVSAVKDGKVLGCKGQCPVKAKGVNRNVKRTDKGVLVTATSPDAEMVEHLQKAAKKMVSDA